MSPVVGLTQPQLDPFWAVADVITAVLVFVNLLLLVLVHGRRLRQYLRGPRQRRFRVQVDRALAELMDPRSSERGRDWLRREVGRFGELERPIAAVLLIERLRPASEEEREQVLEVTREVGALDLLVRSTRRWMPWRRALAVRTLGWLGAPETVPLLIDRVSDRSRAVRECAVRALGRIGDERALSLLGELFRAPGRVGTGVVYDALVAFGHRAEPIVVGALGSPIESVRVAACFGTAALAEPGVARRELEPRLADAAAPVRAAAAEALGEIGGSALPEGLARASRDERATVRAAATTALGSYDDPRATEVAVNALLDPDRDTAIRAGEALVRLARGPVAGPSASAALARAEDSWLVQRALVFDSLGAV
jgi:HEAT repeat protein